MTYVEHLNPTAPLSKDILANYKKLAKIVDQLPANMRQMPSIEGTAGLISATDVIAYQIGWGKLLIGWYEAGIRHEDLVMPGEGFTAWDYAGLARHFYQKYRYDSGKKQDKEFGLVVKRIIGIVETEHLTGNLDKLGVWPWCTLRSGKRWPLSKWVTVNTTSPYKKAAAQLRKRINGKT